MKSSLRPTWGIFGRINQGTETMLFKDKFVDWGDASRLIGVKGFSASGEFSVCTVDCRLLLCAVSSSSGKLFVLYDFLKSLFVGLC